MRRLPALLGLWEEGAQRLGPRVPEAEGVADYQGLPFSAPCALGLEKKALFLSLFSLKEGW